MREWNSLEPIKYLLFACASSIAIKTSSQQATINRQILEICIMMKDSCLSGFQECLLVDSSPLCWNMNSYNLSDGL